MSTPQSKDQGFVSAITGTITRSLANFVAGLHDPRQRRKNVIILLGGGLLVLIVLMKATKRRAGHRMALGDLTSRLPVPTEADTYDVAIVGGGISGSTCGWYLSKAGRKVLVLEKKKFPRDKICGDAVTTIAQKHLKVMGVLKEIIDEDEGHWAQNGGFVSPGGQSFIGNSAAELGRATEGTVVAVKRIVMDDKVAKAGQRAGNDLKENTTVVDAVLRDGLWHVECVDEANNKIFYKARIIVAADGAPSNFARKKGLVTTEPQSVCSRSYIKGKHNFKWDGVVFYPRQLLPGYCALLRHAKDELGFCTYIIPGGPAGNDDLSRLHHDILANDPYVSKAVGNDPSLEIERMKGASLRLGGEKRTYDRQMLVIGDAAGFIDPLTGEGIQYAFDSAKWGADAILDALNSGDLSERMMKRYHDHWQREWGSEFYWSMKMSLALYHFPIFLDAAAKLIQRRGSKFLADWAEVMTGSQSKLFFVRPDVGPLIALEAVGLLFKRIFG